MECLYKTRQRESDPLKTVLALYDQDIGHQNMQPSEQRLKTMVKKSLGQKVRARNFEASNERTVTGAPAKCRSKGASPSGKNAPEAVQRSRETKLHDSIVWFLESLQGPELPNSIRLQVRRQVFVLSQRSGSSAEQETKEKRPSRLFKKRETSGLRCSRSCAAA